MTKEEQINIFSFKPIVFLIVLIQFGIILILGLVSVHLFDPPKYYNEFDLTKTENKIACEYNVKTFPIMTGFLHNEKIGEMALVNMKKEECTSKSFNKFLL